jgi:hypothetical protein
VVRVTIVNKALAEEAERLAPGGEVWHRVWEATKYAGKSDQPKPRGKKEQAPTDEEERRPQGAGRKKKDEALPGQGTWL